MSRNLSSAAVVIGFLRVKLRIKCFVQGHTTVIPLGLDPATP